MVDEAAVVLLTRVVEFVYKPVLDDVKFEPADTGAVVKGAMVNGTVVTTVELVELPADAAEADTEEATEEAAAEMTDVMLKASEVDEESPVVSGTEVTPVPLEPAVMLVPFPRAYGALEVLEEEA